MTHQFQFGKCEILTNTTMNGVEMPVNWVIYTGASQIVASLAAAVVALAAT